MVSRPACAPTFVITARSLGVITLWRPYGQSLGPLLGRRAVNPGTLNPAFNYTDLTETRPAVSRPPVNQPLTVRTHHEVVPLGRLGHELGLTLPDTHLDVSSKLALLRFTHFTHDPEKRTHEHV